MPTTLFLRIAAGFVDAMIALTLAGAAFTIAHGTAGALVLDRRALWAAMAVFALRDVASGASAGKWLMGLRLETAAGSRPGLGSRLARVPWGIFPLALVPAIERRTPWRVAAYLPTGAGLAARALIAVVALGTTLLWGRAALRPSIGRDDALQLVQETLIVDPFLQSQLGPPMSAEVGDVAPRSGSGWNSSEGAFQLRIRGSRAIQTMTVRARKVDGAWAVDEVTDIEISATGAGRDPVVSR